MKINKIIQLFFFLFISSFCFAENREILFPQDKLINYQQNFLFKDKNVPLESNEDFLEIPDNFIINTYTIWRNTSVYIGGKIRVIEDGCLKIDNCDLYFSPNSGITIENKGIIIAENSFFISDSFASWSDYDYALKFIDNKEDFNTINNCLFACAANAIILNNSSFSTSIFNNIFYCCYNSIYIFHPIGKISIENNEIFNSYYSGIEVVFDPNASADPNFVNGVIISNNSIRGAFDGGYFAQEYGILAYGVPNLENAGFVTIDNNVIISSYSYAIGQYSGYMQCLKTNNAYGRNYSGNNNPGNPFSDINPIELIYDPYIYGFYELYPYIDPCSVIINSGDNYTCNTNMVGLTNQEDEFPDQGIIDRGYHYFGNYITSSENKEILGGDINEDLKIDIEDLIILSNNWLKISDPNYWDPNFLDQLGDRRCSLAGDYLINLEDFAVISKNWLKEKEINYKFSIDINNINKNLIIDCNYIPDDIYAIYLRLDNNIENYCLDRENDNFIINTSKDKNGLHKLNLSIIDFEGNIKTPEPIYLNFSNEISDVISENKYEEYYHLRASCNFSEYNICVDANDHIYNFFRNSQIIDFKISQEILGRLGKIKISNCPLIPNNASLGDFQDIDFDDWEDNIYQKFNKDDKYNKIVKALIILPSQNMTEIFWPVIENEINAYYYNKIPFAVLYYTDVTWENLTYTLKEMPNLLYISYHGHAYSSVDIKSDYFPPVNRTSLEFWEYVVKENKLDKWTRRHVFSFLKDDAPAVGLPNLPGDFETTGKSMYQLGIHHKKYKSFFADGCETARWPDMALSVGIGWLDGRNEYGVYTGFVKERYNPDWLDTIIDRTNEAIAEVYKNWKTGNSWGNSFSLASYNIGNRKVFYGNDGEPDDPPVIGGTAADYEDNNIDNLRFYSSSMNSWNNLFLQ